MEPECYVCLVVITDETLGAGIWNAVLRSDFVTVYNSDGNLNMSWMNEDIEVLK